MRAQTHLSAGPGSQTHTDMAPGWAGVSDLGSPLGPLLSGPFRGPRWSIEHPTAYGNWPPQRSETTSGA